MDRLNCMNIDMVSWCYLITVLTSPAHAASSFYSNNSKPPRVSQKYQRCCFMATCTCLAIKQHRHHPAFCVGLARTARCALVALIQAFK